MTSFYSNSTNRKISIPNQKVCGWKQSSTYNSNGWVSGVRSGRNNGIENRSFSRFSRDDEAKERNACQGNANWLSGNAPVFRGQKPPGTRFELRADNFKGGVTASYKPGNTDIEAIHVNRRGRGNNLLERPEFHKPPIMPRNVVEFGGLKQLDVSKDILKALVEIKEPDPMDIKWLEEKDRLIKNIKRIRPDITDDELAAELRVNKPLGREQRTLNVKTKIPMTGNVNIDKILASTNSLSSKIDEISKSVRDGRVDQIEATNAILNTIRTSEIGLSEKLRLIAREVVDGRVSALESQAIIIKTISESKNNLSEKLRLIAREVADGRIEQIEANRLIHRMILDTNMNITEKIISISQQIERGVITNNEGQQLILTAIDGSNEQLADKLTLVKNQLEMGQVGVIQAQRQLIKIIQNSNENIDTKLKTIQTAVDGGVIEAKNQSDMVMSLIDQSSLNLYNKLDLMVKQGQAQNINQNKLITSIFDIISSEADKQNKTSADINEIQAMLAIMLDQYGTDVENNRNQLNSIQLAIMRTGVVRTPEEIGIPRIINIQYYNKNAGAVDFFIYSQFVKQNNGIGNMEQVAFNYNTNKKMKLSSMRTKLGVTQNQDLILDLTPSNPDNPTQIGIPGLVKITTVKKQLESGRIRNSQIAPEAMDLFDIAGSKREIEK
jgi:hypothetical protein